MQVDAERVQAVFLAAVAQSDPAARAAVLDRECGGDAELRVRVEALLRALDQPDDLLDRPLVATAEGSTIDAPTNAADTVIGGRYKLLERIGEGGMGEVWMAQQTEPVNRLVAVKLIKPGMDSKAVLARFEAERQALALMDHPNIAKVFDAGTAESSPHAPSDEPAARQTRAPHPEREGYYGRPFFVMELVKGIPITQYCDEHHLTPRHRLELFVPVCHAIQHAHQKGVIHRDLKPTNVLVARYDDQPVPKVIDFGVAKAAGQQLTEQTLHTGFGAVVGTVEYMSPEQATFNQLDVDTRTDIYSLGVLLYELLAGSPPFTRKELEKVGLLEMLRVIREREPPKPSTKLSTAEGLPTLAANRGTEPKRLTALMRGELDWIVMKALEKDRARRYETANGLAMDLQRYLADEPVQACPPRAGYRLRKFVRRNRRAVLAAAAVAAALVTGTTIAAWQAVRATRAASAEAEQRQRADGAAEVAKANEQLAVGEKTRADQKAEESRQRLVRQYVSHGAHHLDEGDLLGSLPWFVKALALEHDPQVQLMHRTRLGALFRLAPRLEQVWTHGGSMVSSLFSPDGTRIVTYGSGTDRLGLAQVWDARTGRPVTPPLRHKRADWPPEWEQPVGLATFSADGKLLATENVGTVVVWDVTSAKQQAAWERSGYVYRMRFTPDGSRLLVNWAEGVSRDVSRYAAQAWDAHTGKPVTPLMLSEHIFQDGAGEGDAVFSPDGRRVAITDMVDDRTVVRVVDVSTGKDLLRLKPERAEEHIVRADFTPDGKRLLTTTRDHEARLWDADTGKSVGLMANIGKMTNQAYSVDGSRLLTFDTAASVWDMASGNRIATCRPQVGTIRYADLSADGLRALTVTDDGTLQVWEVTGQTRVGPALRMSRHNSPKFSTDGRRVLVADGRHAWLWDYGVFEPDRPLDNITWTVETSVDQRRMAPEQQALRSDGRRLAVARGGRLRLFDPATGSSVGDPMAYAGRATAIVFAADGGTLALVGQDQRPDNRPGALRTYRFDANGRGPAGEPRDLGAANFGTIDPTLRWVAVARYDEKADSIDHLQLWDLAPGKPGPVSRELGKRGYVGAFSRDGGRFLTCTGDELRVWDTATGEPIGPPFKQPGYSNRAAFTADGERLLISYSGTPGAWGDGRVRLWDVRAGQLLFELAAHGVAHEGFALSPDGARIVTAAGRTARVWDAATGRPLTPPMRHPEELQTVTFTADSRAIITTSFHYQTQLWDAATGEPLTPPLGVFRFPALTPDGRLVLQDDATLVYDVRPDDRPLEELRLLAEALSGHRIDDTGGYVPLSDDDHDAVWTRLRAVFPDAQPMTPERERAWHAARAEICERDERWDDVVTHLTPLIEAQPHRWRLWASRGRAHRELEEWEKGVADLTAAIDRGAEDPTVWLDRGHCRAEQDQFRDAAADFARAAAMTGETVEPLRALALLAAGDRAGYRAVAKRILDVLNTKAELYNSDEVFVWPLVLPAGEKFDLTKVIAMLERTVARKGAEAEDFRNLGAALLRAGKFKDAIRRLDEAYQAQPEVYPSAWLLLALAHHRSGNPADAKKWFDRAAKWLDDPDSNDDLDWPDRLKLRLLREEFAQLLGVK